LPCAAKDPLNLFYNKLELARRLSASSQGMSATAATHPVIVQLRFKDCSKSRTEQGKFFSKEQAYVLMHLSSSRQNFSSKNF